MDNYILVMSERLLQSSQLLFYVRERLEKTLKELEGAYALDHLRPQERQGIGAQILEINTLKTQINAMIDKIHSPFVFPEADDDNEE